MKDEPNVLCSCGNKMFRVISGGTGFIIQEGNGDISDKSDSYWANAEANRIKDLKVRHSNFKEQLKYKDKEVIGKLETKAQNLKNTGKEIVADHINRALDGEK